MTELLTLAVLALGAGVVSALAEKLRLPTPLVLLSAGIIGGLFFKSADVIIDPEVIIGAVLPVLVFAGAARVNVVDVRRDLAAVTVLSVVLVILSAAAAAGVVHLLLPMVPWPTACVLGAVVSPTDPVAFISVARSTGLPVRVRRLVELEGLLNDATALTLLKLSLTATATGFTLWEAPLELFYVISVSAVIGFAGAMLAVLLRHKTDHQYLKQLFVLLTPLIVAALADLVGGSGIGAAVAAGLTVSSAGAQRLVPQDRISEQHTWDGTTFVLETTLFLTMGLQFPGAVGQLSGRRLLDVAILVAVVVAALVVLRYLVVMPMVACVAWDERRSLKETKVARYRKRRLRRLRRGPGAAAVLDRQIAAYQKFVKNHELSIGDGVLIGSAGVRGAVTVAAIQTIPLTTPYRAEMIVAALSIAAVTMLVAALVLPLLGRVFQGTATTSDELDELLKDMNTAALASICDEQLAGRGFDAGVVQSVRDAILAGQKDSAGDGDQRSSWATAYAQYQMLSKLSFRASREVLNDARILGVHGSESVLVAQQIIDEEEQRVLR